MRRNSRPTGDILASDVTSLTGTTPKMRRIYKRRPDATRELICSHVIPVGVCITRAFTASDHEEPTGGHNSFAVLHTCSQLTDEGAVGYSSSYRRSRALSHFPMKGTLREKHIENPSHVGEISRSDCRESRSAINPWSTVLDCMNFHRFHVRWNIDFFVGHSGRLRERELREKREKGSSFFAHRDLPYAISQAGQTGTRRLLLSVPAGDRSFTHSPHQSIRKFTLEIAFF
ncbi:hypothetical protein ALC57_04759 [Trachymyrmex cornetzi]|uniref:Uncharacterized protein n=1 Tax=Trachymyrmex cornetzi TaxID=471704 RepID=A0A195ECZ1_9HYME|nr:hypothetical protein ALC57_04759 [Trachymyrmex cornetzi]